MVEALLRMMAKQFTESLLIRGAHGVYLLQNADRFTTTHILYFSNVA